jgi:hypothetical protein
MARLIKPTLWQRIRNYFGLQKSEKLTVREVDRAIEMVFSNKTKRRKDE